MFKLYLDRESNAKLINIYLQKGNQWEKHNQSEKRSEVQLKMASKFTALQLT